MASTSMRFVFGVPLKVTNVLIHDDEFNATDELDDADANKQLVTVYGTRFRGITPTRAVRINLAAYWQMAAGEYNSRLSKMAASTLSWSGSVFSTFRPP